ncbi:DNA-binding protein [uncultured archaeon]|nr:DNA-binding protein [uncultured archaeon]
MAEENEEAQQEQLKAAQQARMQQMQLDAKKRELLRKMLTPSAYERMSNVRISAPELYEKVVSSLAYIAQSGKKMAVIDDEQLRGLLVKMTEKRETKIEFRSK